MNDSNGFILHFYELPPDLQEEKIDQFICSQYADGIFEGEYETIEQALEDEQLRDVARTHIESYFPFTF